MFVINSWIKYNILLYQFLLENTITKFSGVLNEIAYNNRHKESNYISKGA